MPEPVPRLLPAHLPFNNSQTTQHKADVRGDLRPEMQSHLPTHWRNSVSWHSSSTSHAGSSSRLAAYELSTRINLLMNTTTPSGTTYQNQEPAFRNTFIQTFYFWMENIFQTGKKGTTFHLRPVARCWHGVNSGSSLLQRPHSRFAILNIKSESMWFVANHFTSECLCGMMSFFCLTEFMYEIKGAIKIHCRFTAVIHNFLPTLFSQLTELSFQSK